MTRDEIAARNRANAAKSTGPKTVQGKAVVAGNARRHGATARPDPAAVATWLRIILDDPDITARALPPTDTLGYRALMLAQAEVQLVTATNALRDFEAEMPLILRVAKQLTGKDILEGFASGEQPRRDRTRSQTQVYRDILVRRAELRSAERQQRLFKRYLGEARAQRRKAFLAWLLANRGEEIAA